MNNPNTDKAASVSAVIIAGNAEKDIKECLEALTWCDEIVVVTDPSSGGHTIEIASEFTEKIFIEEWKGFGRQKQSAVQKASSEWVLSIDTDERITEALRDEIRKLLARSTGVDGYFIPRKNFYKGKWLRRGGQYPDYTMRLFRKARGRFTEDIVHEKVLIEGKTGKLKNPIEHYSFEDITTRIEKLNRYSTLSAEQLHDKGKKAGTLSPLVHFMSFFIRDYVLRLGFLDGAEGLNAALLKSLGTYFKYAKLIEIKKPDPS